MSNDIDISDTYDTQLHDLYEVPARDWTTDVPPIPDTTDLHPAGCPCIPCQMDREIDWWEARQEAIVARSYPGCL